ncbi:hypothetical protein [Mycetocola sp. JXN-3]|uniref:hypothetical protein n=1 Tax=Mycetocola sp. JXN-3 TaxID=2116510 RepID=UPI00165D1E15|nr:hypothetical protein [Mycetocola sp. JXN-3]
MRRSILRGFSLGLLSPAGPVVIALMIALALAASTVRPPSPDTDAWDLYFVVVGNPQFGGILMFLWAVPVARSLNRVVHPDTLMRSGSRARAAGEATGELAGRGLVHVVMLCAAVLVIAAPRGMGAGWSGLALGRASGLSAEDGAGSFAEYIDLPIFAVFLHLVWIVVALTLVTATALVLAAAGLTRTARLIVPASGTLITLAAFGALPWQDPPARAPDATPVWNFDPASLIDPGHALNTGTWPGTGAFLGLLTFASVLVLWHRDGRRFGGGRWVGVGALIVAGTIAVWGAGPISGDSNEVLAILFPGRFGDPIGYVRTMLLPLVAATLAARSLATAGAAWHLQLVLRLGSFARWLASMLVRFAALAVMTAGFGLFLMVIRAPSLVIAEPPDEGTRNVGALAILTLGLFAHTLMLLALVLLLWWVRAIEHAWPVALGAYLILGYPAIVPLGPIAAVISPGIDPGHPGKIWPDLAGPLLTAMGLIIALAVLARTRIPYPLRSALEGAPS